MTGEPCPQCGRPIPDTAYICPACQDRLAGRLRSAASLWEHVQDTVAHQTHVEGNLPATRHADPIGPIHVSCDDPSCDAIWKHRVRNRGLEPAAPHEDRGIVDWAASERAWVVTNTIDTWTSKVASQRGNAPRRPVLVRPELHTIHDDERPHLCVFSDLPIEQCACGHEHRESA